MSSILNVGHLLSLPMPVYDQVNTFFMELREISYHSQEEIMDILDRITEFAPQPDVKIYGKCLLLARLLHDRLEAWTPLTTRPFDPYVPPNLEDTVQSWQNRIFQTADFMV